MILIDTGPLFALMDRRDQFHQRAVSYAKSIPRLTMLTTWPCFTEVMYLVGDAIGVSGQLSVWDQVRKHHIVLDSDLRYDIDRMIALMTTYADLPMDLADASLVALAEREKLAAIWTFDKHFHAYRFQDGSAPTIVG